jgi:hypothetical protein
LFHDEGSGLVLDGSARLIGEGIFYWEEADQPQEANA